MATINNLGYRTSTQDVVSKGLVLGNKEGFYRDLGADIFNNSDYVRIAVAMTFNLLSNPNTFQGSIYDNVTNNTVNEGFYFGFKSPNSSMPGTGHDPATKFAGYWVPPTASSGKYSGYSGSNKRLCTFVAPGGSSVFSTTTMVFGSLTQPITFQNAINSTSPSEPQFISNGATLNSLTGQYVTYLGLELNSSNTMKAYYVTSQTDPVGYATGASLAAMTNLINNEIFTTRTISLSGAPYGNATSMFLYNPLNTVCLRVHGMIAAGFKN